MLLSNYLHFIRTLTSPTQALKTVEKQCQLVTIASNILIAEENIPVLICVCTLNSN